MEAIEKIQPVEDLPSRRSIGNISGLRLRHAVERSSVGVVFYTADTGKIRYANEGFERLVGASSEALRLGIATMDELTVPEWRVRAHQATSTLKKVGDTMTYDKEIVHADNTRVTVSTSVTRIAPNELVEFLVNVSDRKRTEEQLRRHREELEDLILERTGELDAANGALRDELLEKDRSEAERKALIAEILGVQEEERRRISRELHDQVGQHITALSLGLKNLGAIRDLPTCGDTVEDLLRLTDSIGKEIHDLAYELRPTALDDFGLVRTLTHYVEKWSGRTQVPVEFHHEAWPDDHLASAAETTIYRVVCEAFTNIMKHANARHVSLILQRTDDEAVAIIEDDGRGFQPQQRAKLAESRLGLTGMRERAVLIGGSLSIESAPGNGTTIFLRIPWRRPAT